MGYQVKSQSESSGRVIAKALFTCHLRLPDLKRRAHLERYSRPSSVCVIRQ